MNVNDENIDKLFRDAANNSQSPEFQDAYWSEMDALIKQNQMAKKNRFLDLVWVVSGFSSLLFLLTLGLFMNSSINNNETIVEYSDESKGELANTNKVPKKNRYTIDPINSFDKNNTDNDINLGLSEQNEDEHIKRTSNDRMEDSSEEISRYNSKETIFEKSTSIISKQENGPIARGHAVGIIDDEVPEGSEYVNNISERSYLSPIRLSPKLVQLSNELASKDELILMGTKRIRPEHAFSLDVGLSFAESYQGTSSSSNRFSFAGLYNLDYNNIILRTGIGVTVERSSNLSVREESMIYSYTATKYEHILDYKMFTEVFVPLEIGCRFNNTTFGAGGQINMLIGTRMNHTERINDEIVQNRMLNNRTEGLSSFTGGAYIWIQQHLNARLMAGARIGKNIGSRIDAENYLHTVSKPSPVFGQVYISYQIFKK